MPESRPSPADGVEAPLDLSALRSAVQSLTDALGIVTGPDFASADPRWRDLLNFRDLIRLGHERGLVADVGAWFEFRELRNITSHTYSRTKARQVAAGAPALLEQCRALLSRLEERNLG